MGRVIHSDVVVVGWGLSGLVTTLECLRAGKIVTLVDPDEPEKMGGLAKWAFGGMALVGTPLQARMGIPDNPEVALRDWIRFGELSETDLMPRRWAEYYVNNSRVEVYDWLRELGVRFMPAVNWVERGLYGDGNSLPRYHVIWGTSLELTRRVIAAVNDAAKWGGLTVLARHRVTHLDRAPVGIAGAVAVNEETGEEVCLRAPSVVLAMGGINGSQEQVRANWRADRPVPQSMLNGAHPISDGRLHHWVGRYMGGKLTHTGEMWNYAAGIPHPFPHFPGHGLSLVPCKSALWLADSRSKCNADPE